MGTQTLTHFAKSTVKVGASNMAQDLDLSTEEVEGLLAFTEKVKSFPARYARALSGKYLALLFEKPSFRTRLTFELAIKQLGGDAVLIEGKIGDREPLKDVARNLARWTDCIVARTFTQQTVEDLAKWSQKPVINALSDLYHPCQALADVFTIYELDHNLKGKKLVFVGNGSDNVCHSLMLTAVRLGMKFWVAAPQECQPNPDIVIQADALASVSGGSVTITNDPFEAVDGACAVYTDVWTSMGEEDQKERRRMLLKPYQVNDILMKATGRETMFMHCLPAHRGEEVTDDVIESEKYSMVHDQAENRLHTQKALLLALLAKE